MISYIVICNCCAGLEERIVVIEQELERERKELEKWQKYKVNEVLFPPKFCLLLS